MLHKKGARGKGEADLSGGVIIESEESLRAGNADWVLMAEPDKGHARMLRAFVEEIRGLRAAPVSPGA